MHAGTRFGSDGKRPTVMYSCRASVSYHFLFGPSWPRLVSFAQHSGGVSAGVAVGGRGLGGLGTHGSVVDGDSSHRVWTQCAFLKLSASMCAIGVEFGTFAGSLPRLTSLHMASVPGFHQMPPRATPSTAVFPKS